MMSSDKKTGFGSLRNFALLIGLGLLLYAVLPQIHTFHDSLGLLRSVSLAPLLAAVAVSLLATAAASAKYQVLALWPVRYFPTLMVQSASLLTNRLLPAGIGGMGINYMFLRKFRHSQSQAATVVAMNNIVGLVGHMLLVAVLLVTVHNISAPSAFQLSGKEAIAGSVLLLVLVGCALYWKASIQNGLKDFRRNLRLYIKRPMKLIAGTMLAVVLATAYALCLYYSARALGVQLAFVSALVVLTLGVTASTVTPTPGGLIGVEAAMLAGLVAYGVSAADALAVALLFRLITYWLSMVIGAFALWAVKVHQII